MDPLPDNRAFALVHDARAGVEGGQGTAPAMPIPAPPELVLKRGECDNPKRAPEDSPTPSRPTGWAPSITSRYQGAVAQSTPFCLSSLTSTPTKSKTATRRSGWATIMNATKLYQLTLTSSH